MNLAPVRVVLVTEAILASTVATATGVGAAVSSGYAGADSLTFQLDVTAASGTTPTLDVLVQDSTDGVNFFTLATFAQAVTIAHTVQRVNMSTNKPLDKLRVSYTIGGGTPSFTFSVTAIAMAKVASDRQP